nr:MULTISPECIES: glycosyltransferase [unclassified Ciceribacter]
MVVQDYCQVGGGAERLVNILCRDLPDCALWTSGVYADFLRSGVGEDIEVKVLGERLAFLPRQARAMFSFMFLGQCLPKARNVIYSGIFAPLAVSAQRSGKRICYCHTPPKFAFEQSEKYRLSFNLFLRPLFSLGVAAYRRKYLQAMRRMDLIVTNSANVQRRIDKYLGLPSHVIYPPVDIDLFRWISQGDFYLSLGRLEPNKRVDLVVQAFRQMPDKKLVVASGGSQLEHIRRLAEGAPNIAVLGWVDDQKLAELVGRSIACLYLPADEDFGMSAVEAMAAGKPVIAVNEGGLVETIVDGETGNLLPAAFGVAEICQAVEAMDCNRALSMRQACEKRAKEFSRVRFIENIRAILEPDETL